MQPSNPTPSECPVCGEPVPSDARACPNCGADEQSGWNDEESRYDGIDLPDSEEERSAARPGSPRWSRLWTLVAAALVVSLLYLIFR
jgi:hypothetical protein